MYYSYAHTVCNLNLIRAIQLVSTFNRIVSSVASLVKVNQSYPQSSLELYNFSRHPVFRSTVIVLQGLG